MADVDFTKVEQPDELIQLAWHAGFDRKAVIREGSDAAHLLFVNVESDLRTLFWPVPRRLEAVDRWSENARPVTGVSESLRPFASAVIPGCVLGSLITWFLVAPRVSEDHALTAMTWIIVASTAVLGIVLKVWIGATLRRQAARLDEEAALKIVLDELRAGMIACPEVVPRAVTRIRRGLANQK